MKLKSEPGKKFAYASGNTQLLGAVLEAALKGKSISTYLEEKIWKPLQMEYDASWSLDRKKEWTRKNFLLYQHPGKRLCQNWTIVFEQRQVEW